MPNADVNSEPLQIVIFGGSGDLSLRKLLPALLDLYQKKCLPRHVDIIGVARTERTNEDFRTLVADALDEHAPGHSQKTKDRFCKLLSYQAGDFDSNDIYLELAETLHQRNEKYQRSSNRIFYLAVPPDFYAVIFNGIHVHKLHKTEWGSDAWARILVEKPFGSDYESAQLLDRKLGGLFHEDQIYRIDHYLAKEAVQNILSFRFANRVLSGVWNNEHIKHISVTMHETLDVGSRGSFYDSIGALRDVGQNHLLQLIALLTMREPTHFTPEEIRTERARILKTLVCQRSSTIAESYQHAQYVGYKKTKGVKTGSTTETFFNLTAELSDRNWRGVPIHISAGKALKEAKVEVKVAFKDIATGPFLTDNCQTAGNELVLTISPEQTMRLTLNAKAPGLGYQLETRTLAFDCAADSGEIKNAYERILRDCITGDQTLFTTTDEVMAQWRFVNSILKYRDRVPLGRYKKGSGGPKCTIFNT